MESNLSPERLNRFDGTNNLIPDTGTSFKGSEALLARTLADGRRALSLITASLAPDEQTNAARLDLNWKGETIELGSNDELFIEQGRRLPFELTP